VGVFLWVKIEVIMGEDDKGSGGDRDDGGDRGSGVAGVE